MPHTLTLTLIAVVHVLLGLFIGLCFRPKHRRGLPDWTADGTSDDEALRRLRIGLQGFTTEPRAGAGAKGFRVDDVGGREQDRRKGTSISNVSSNCAPHDVAEILDVNERLKRKLDSVEQEIARQARELTLYKNQALTDPLTGLNNRRAFDDVLERRTGERASRKTPVSLLVLDIDHFKTFNDRFGHAAGDVVLKGVAQILADEIRDLDFVARIGGEEFAVVLNATALDDAIVASERLRLAVRRGRYFFEQHEMSVTISLGIKRCYHNDLITPESIDVAQSN